MANKLEVTWCTSTND